ncbi:type IV pilus assembly protein PilM [Clostridium cochlearium]|uniref:Type IV pilus assembly protein PilM n=1 Tax=Clostridium cochlearium TaxID=1494 RepID=A0ABY0QIU0_CLOCO|nr:type IV pilus assembly protein PilM [Clostridium cochlearium]SDK90310.1 type IV pilus assembly protein PilM [Clostridium cochlearium]
MFSKKVLSIDMGGKNIKIVTGEYKKSKLYIDNTIMIPTPSNSLEDGNIINKDKLVEALDNILGMNEINIKDVYFTTNSKEIINREMIVPKAEEDELDTVVEFEVQQYLPIILDNYVIQYQVLEEIKGESEEASIDKLRIMVVAYPKSMVEQYLSLAEELDLNPKVLDVNFNAISKLFKNNIETIALVDIGAENININIVSNGKIEFTRIIQKAGDLLDKTIAFRYDLDIEEGEKRKKQYVDLREDNEDNKEQVLEELNTVVKEKLNEIIEDVGKVVQFYKNKNVGNKIDKIYIYGGGSRLKGIEEYSEAILNIPVVKINSMSNVVLEKNVNEEDLDYYLNAIGAIIRL